MQNATNSEVEDIQLAKACLGGNSKAQSQLFKKYAGQMMALCLRYGNDYEEAQDMFQEGFIKVFQKLNKYDGKGPLGAWIRRTIANNSLDIIRKNTREQTNIATYQIEFQLDSEIATLSEDQNEPGLNSSEIMDLVRQMPMGYRTVFNMYAVEEYTHKEIADQLGISESTSKTQYRKAKAYMRKLIFKETEKSTSDQR